MCSRSRGDTSRPLREGSVDTVDNAPPHPSSKVLEPSPTPPDTASTRRISTTVAGVVGVAVEVEGAPTDDVPGGA